MYILTITYPNQEGATFDWEYYRGTHLPSAGKALSPFGLGYASVLKGEAQADGSPPVYLAQAMFSFSDEAGAKEAWKSGAATQLVADVVNFTNVAPKMQFNTAVR